MRKLESDMLGSILELDDVEVGEIMTHRKDMLTIDVDTPVADAVRFVQEKPFTRYPVWRGDPDTIVGVLHAKDLLAAVFRAGPSWSGPNPARRPRRSPPGSFPTPPRCATSCWPSASAAPTSPWWSTSTARCRAW